MQQKVYMANLTETEKRLRDERNKQWEQQQREQLKPVIKPQEAPQQTIIKEVKESIKIKKDKHIKKLINKSSKAGRPKGKEKRRIYVYIEINRIKEFKEFIKQF